ncbi:Rha family transcriptional regulator [Pseudomonas aeruginosa]|uniref:Rha family transcriptional regulator n=1 Tax=Pseudomonas aeruginosa TaxID=287 RepID=UPI000EB3A2F3|nr:Rha family transcriptional regulator [Pseudomonas aeruginosa]HBO5698444.1 Rha family transcriptional regulator [Pseudomonas aeruginosa]HBO5754597.1 Rha family transcriptional regulator [Pseudomonas aeruginosa]HBO5931186.1 Rha family transcriptional regulator [Pseudomonas aeruginosa]HBO6037919.1 Rha family transcriptional regulator [Pseudomonas aeruginosa]HBO6216339.1 Rha family transcriptional regulator [Pseudomonas aeruginosa]
MINLTTTIGGQPVTMSSREITELTGKQHKHVIRDIREMLDALEKDGPVLGHVREDKDSRGYTENFHLDRELTETLVTGYSIPLRHKVIRRLHELEEQVAQPAIPQTLPEALRLAADLAEECQQLAAERDHAVKTKAQIGSRREAQAMAKASSAVRQVQRLNDELGHGTRFATVTAVEIAAGEKFPINAYVPLRKWCQTYGIQPEDVPDRRYGKVKAWPAAAWLAVYGIDLTFLFGASGAQA